MSLIGNLLAILPSEHADDGEVNVEVKKSLELNAHHDVPLLHILLKGTSLVATNKDRGSIVL